MFQILNKMGSKENFELQSWCWGNSSADLPDPNAINIYRASLCMKLFLGDQL